VAGSAIFVLVPFFFIHDEKSPSAILNALLISTIPGILLLFLRGYGREEEHRIIKKIWTGSVTALVAFIVTGIIPALGGTGLLKTLV
jgi:VIT1/CCC1 family predicted Fe2+/Mn2+ transporter